MPRTCHWVIAVLLWISLIDITIVIAQSEEPPWTKQYSKTNLTEVVKSVLQEHPELILDALEKDPVALADLVERASIARTAQAEQERRLDELKNPKVPAVDLNRPIRGNPKALITIVEYSDFECPFCRSASSTVNQVLNQYGDEVRFIYKHNALNFHPMAEPAARYFEAIALQDTEEAWRFHDLVFEQQDLLVDGEPVLNAIVATLKVDQKQLAEDLNGDIVTQRLSHDRLEVDRFGFDGTPAFLINGVSLMGSQPMEEFEDIIQIFLDKNLDTEHAVAELEE